MKIKIPYDGAMVDVKFPRRAVMLEGKTFPALSEDSIREKIASGVVRFPHSARPKNSVIVINDATRRLATSKILSILSESLVLTDEEVLIATGTHRPPTGNELDAIFNDAYHLFGGRISIHNCHDLASLDYLGVTSRGTPVWINKKAMAADRIICINSVEPHFFAGFSGGRKSLIPGLAGIETTIANHSHAKDENARSMNLETNPVHLDLVEAVSLIRNKEIFSIQLVMSRQGEIVDLFCGDLSESFAAACRTAREVYSVPIDKKFDIVMAIGEPPLDINLYQLQKGQEHGAEAVKDGGILIVVGACNEGSGSDFFMNLANDYPDPQSALSAKALSDNRFGIHKLIKTARRLQKIKIWYVTKLDDSLVSKVYFTPKSSLQKALDEALEEKGKRATIAILRDACFIVPVMNDFKGGR
jgi:nickel-dependent lactate racemase